jgi:TonB family protein
MMRCLFPVALAISLQACVAPMATYRIGDQGRSLARDDAERAIIQGNLKFKIPEGWLDSTPRIIEAHLPEYPAELRSRNFQGTVAAHFHIQPDGTVNDVVTDKGPPLGALVAEAVRKWKFEPPMRHGEPVGVFGHFTYVFKLAN